MSESITIQDIYKLFEKTNEEFKQSQREYDRRSAEADRRAAESDRRAAEADKSLAELKKAVERTTKAVDSLTTRWGRFVEELVEPAVIKLFRAKGIDVKETYSRARVKRIGRTMVFLVLMP